MSFRRKQDAGEWLQRLRQYEDLFLQAGIPEYLLRDENTWWRFLLHGYHQDAKHPPVLIETMFSAEQRRALTSLLKAVYTEHERESMSSVWHELDRLEGRH